MQLKWLRIGFRGCRRMVPGPGSLRVRARVGPSTSLHSRWEPANGGCSWPRRSVGR